MIDIDSLYLRNFLSYADYDTEIKLANLGPCFIRGIVEDGSSDNTRRSNGAGKSTIPSAIQWCLFGRTSHTAQPGAEILHWFGTGDAKVNIALKNGGYVTRMRGRSGKKDLIYAGPDQSYIDTTLSTVSNEQAKLAQALSLDWHAFCGSTVISQYMQPWLEMSDTSRKQAIERILHLDRFSTYAEVSKADRDKLDSNAATKRTAVTTNQQTIENSRQTLKDLQQSSERYEQERTARSERHLAEAAKSEQEAAKLTRIDTETLAKRWETVQQISAAIEQKRTEKRTLQTDLATVTGQIASVKTDIARWEKASGTICIACKQEIPHTHADSEATPSRARLQELLTKKGTLDTDIKKLTDYITKVEARLTAGTPTVTVRQAVAHNANYDVLLKAAQKHRDEAAKALTDENPHLGSISKLQARMDAAAQTLVALDSELQKVNYLVEHYNYVTRRYSDRKYMKSFVMADHLPLFNNKLKEYLEAFDLDIMVELTDALGISSNIGSYKFESGGERKRTDVAFALAMFDLHCDLYGQQCNVLVLDEVDGRLDEGGVQCLIDVIKNDLANRIETILIISHKKSMEDVFGSEIVVKRTGTIANKDRQSRIVEIR